MQIEVNGLPPAEGRRFQLWLTKDGKPAALCGSFLTEPTARRSFP